MTDRGAKAKHLNEPITEGEVSQAIKEAGPEERDMNGQRLDNILVPCIAKLCNGGTRMSGQLPLTLSLIYKDKGDINERGYSISVANSLTKIYSRMIGARLAEHIDEHRAWPEGMVASLRPPACAQAEGRKGGTSTPPYVCFVDFENRNILEEAEAC